MEKFKANLKKNSINPGNLKASHQNAEKRINNSDKITCRNSAFEENSLADNALIKFPLHNELSIKKEVVKLKKKQIHNFKKTLNS